jgi:hypothetical protein
VRRHALSALLLAVAVGAAAASKKPATPDFDESLPPLGMQLSELPEGAGKAIAAEACLKCHSADVLRQQRLDEKKWTASVNKMIGWGAEVPEAGKDELIRYLVKSFGPDNDRWKPLTTRPVGR